MLRIIVAATRLGQLPWTAPRSKLRTAAASARPSCSPPSASSSRPSKSSSSTTTAGCCGRGTSGMNLTRHTTLEKFVDRDVVRQLPTQPAAGARRARARRRHRRRRARRRAGNSAARLVGQPLRIDAKKGPRRRSDRRRTGARRSPSSPRGPKKCCKSARSTRSSPGHWPRCAKCSPGSRRIGMPSTGCCSIKGPAWVEERAEARHHGLLHGWSCARRPPTKLPAPARKA